MWAKVEEGRAWSGVVSFPVWSVFDCIVFIAFLWGLLETDKHRQNRRTNTDQNKHRQTNQTDKNRQKTKQTQAKQRKTDKHRQKTKQTGKTGKKDKHRQISKHSDQDD